MADRGGSQPARVLSSGTYRPGSTRPRTAKSIVIISDAFRYEAAQELTQELNGKYRFEATLSSQLGVLPSYTALGMASLLPHKTLAYKDERRRAGGRQAESSIDQRDSILQAVGRAGVQGDELMAKKKDEGREFVKGKRVVYIYHNTVDAVGDEPATEDKTFEAVRTGDRRTGGAGRLRRQQPERPPRRHHCRPRLPLHRVRPWRAGEEQAEREARRHGAGKKRYLIGQQLPDHEAAWHGRTSVTAGAEGDMEFWIPKGGQSLPLRRRRSLRPRRGDAAGDRRAGRHGEARRRASRPGHEDQAGHGPGPGQQPPDHHQPAPLPVDPDGAGQRAGEADHAEGRRLRGRGAGDEHRDREVRQRFGQHGRAEEVGHPGPAGPAVQQENPYRLVLRDAETGIEQQSVEVVIDRAFTDDF